MARWVFMALLAMTAPALAQLERITSFDSQIVVRQDGMTTVTESISVYAAGYNIRRGIYRDFPTVRGRTGIGQFKVSFDVLEVLRNGKPERWHTEKSAGAVRIYIGNPNSKLVSGPHTYTIKYQTDRQVGFFEDHDELYWNVTGNFWSFMIDEATATIRLPHDATISQKEAYTGSVGDQGRDYVTEQLAPNQMRFESTRPLKKGEGLTVVVGWQPDVVESPGIVQWLRYAMRDNAMFMAALFGFAAVAGYYYWSWSKYGRDPEAGTIIAHYDPPEKMSPAACRYVMNMGWDPTGFTAALINVAVKGYLTISDSDTGDYTVTRTGKTARACKLSKGEKKLVKALFQDGDDFTFEQDNHETIYEARQALRSHLDTDFSDAYFLHNRDTVMAGVMGAAITASMIAVFATPLQVMNLLFQFIFMVCVAGLVIIHAVFYDLMKARTRMGRKVMDHIAGFRHFLRVAEKDRLNFHNPPDITPELFERYLPFALALGVGHDWGEQFDAAMARYAHGPLKQDIAQQPSDSFTPDWYHGDRTGWTSSSSITDSWAPSLTDSIASAATAPSSGSGFSGGGGFSSGGGGFSGGGGGGGGGGGW